MGNCFCKDKDKFINFIILDKNYKIILGVWDNLEKK